MKKICILISIFSIPFFCLGTSKNEIKQQFKEGKFLVLKKEGIPTMPKSGAGAKDAGNRMIDSLFSQKLVINIYPDGNWKCKGLRKQSITNYLGKNEALRILSVKYRSDYFQLKTKTLKNLAVSRGLYGKSFEPHQNIFKIAYSSPDNLLKNLNDYFDVYDTKEEIPVAGEIEIKVGMTIEEVEKLLGKPNAKAVIGNQLKYKYDNWKITFTDGKVTEIDF